MHAFDIAQGPRRVNSRQEAFACSWDAREMREHNRELHRCTFTGVGDAMEGGRDILPFPAVELGTRHLGPPMRLALLCIQLVFIPPRLEV